MHEVVTYVAYDGTEFDSCKDCEQYEGKAFDLLEELFNSYRFFLSNGQEIQIYLNNIEDGLSSFEWAWKKCALIQVKNIPSLGASEFLYINSGCDMPPDEIGLYRYDELKCEWFKVGE